MITYEQAADLVRQRISMSWNVDATPYVSPDGYEDATHYLIPWNTREYLVDGDLSKMLINNVVTFVDKETGEIEMIAMTDNFDRVEKMKAIRR